MNQYKEVAKQLPGDFKPIYNEDGSIDFPVVLTSINPDKELEVFDPKTLIVTPATLVGYNHYKCNGAKVQTGATPLLETLVRTDDIATIYIRVKQTDQMFYCDNGSKEKKSNGSLLEAIKNNWITGISVGAFVDPNKKKLIITSSGKKIWYYYDVIVQEISPLDIAPMQYDAYIINKSQNMQTEKNKCLSCLIEGGVGTYAINPNNEVVKVTEINAETNEVKAVDFNGQEVVLDDTYEPVYYPMQDEVDPLTDNNSAEADKSINQDDEKDKACSCMKKVMPIIEKAEATMAANLDTLEAQTSTNTSSIDEVKNAMSALQEALNSLLEKDKAAKPDFVTLDEVKTEIQDALNINRANGVDNSTPNSKPIKIHPNL